MPNTQYTFRIGVYYGEVLVLRTQSKRGCPNIPPTHVPLVPVASVRAQATAPTSAASKPITTPPLSPPSRMHTAPVLWHGASSHVEVAPDGSAQAKSATSLTISAPPPLDNGGSPVVGVVLESRLADPHMHEGWFPVGSYAVDVAGPVVVTVEHLIPGAAYEFRLTPYNHVGVAAAPGTPSARLRTAAGGEPGLHVHGHGSRTVEAHHVDVAAAHHENAAAVAEHLKGLHDPHVYIQHGPLVTLDDAAQTLTFSGDGAAGGASRRSVEVWASHFSPKAWHATAELIVADPPLADGPLINARAVRQRIVMVERGGVALVDKALRAQAAGALAIVVSDSGDQCKDGFDQFCSPGSDKLHGEGFAKLDRPEPWKNVRIPVVLMRRDDADTLLELF